MRNRRGTSWRSTVTDGTGADADLLRPAAQDWRSSCCRPACAGCSPARSPPSTARRQLAHPEYELLGTRRAGADGPAEFAAELIPVYPASKDITLLADRRLGADSCSTPWTIADDPLPAEPCGPARPAGLADALRGDPPARPTGPTPGGAASG